MVMPNGLGIKVDEAQLKAARPELSSLKTSTSLFTEVCYEVIVVSRESVDAILARWTKHGGAPEALQHLGTVGGQSLALGDALEIGCVELKETYERGWTEAFSHLPARG